MSVFFTFILYNTILLLCPFSCKMGRKGVFFAYFIIAVLSVIRYDIGADYENYAYMVEELKSALDNGYSFGDILSVFGKEPIVILLTKIFSWSEYPYIWVIGAISVFNTVLLYKVLERYQIHALGLFLYIVTFTMSQGWDWVRQSAAMHIFLFSLQYIESRSFSKYLLWVLFASMFHYSALCLLPFYFIYSIRISPTILFLSSLGVFALAELGVFSNVKVILELVMAMYNDDYVGTDHITDGASTYRSSTYIFTMLWYIFVIGISSKVNRQFALFFFAGLVLYAVAGGNLLLVRMAYYFLGLQLLLFPLAFSTYKKGTVVRAMIGCMLFVQVLVFNKVYVGANFRGCTPYETIFSDNCRAKQYRYRDYK